MPHRLTLVADASRRNAVLAQTLGALTLVSDVTNASPVISPPVASASGAARIVSLRVPRFSVDETGNAIDITGRALLIEEGRDTFSAIGVVTESETQVLARRRLQIINVLLLAA